MAKTTMTGTVVSAKMTGSVVVEVTSRNPHPLYKKLIKRSKKFIADSKGMELAEGDTVVLSEMRKVGARKNFKVERKVN